MPEDKSLLMEYIKMQWDDIHHSRRQDWSYIGVIAGVFYAIVQIDQSELRLGFCVIGLVCSVLGAWMAWEHYQIFLVKIGLIADLEDKVGIHYPYRQGKLPVQLMIYLLFASLACGFTGMALYFLCDYLNLVVLRPYSIVISMVLFAAICVGVFISRWKTLHKDQHAYQSPYTVEQDLLEEALDFLDPQPLKLIVDSLWKKERFKEIPWEDPQWAGDIEDGKLNKPVLLNRRDAFQFSIAGARSRQDWHYHRRTMEIYVSHDPMSIEYRDKAKKDALSHLKVERGAIIVPPGIQHSITLSGLAYVFQAAMSGEQVHLDKITTGSRGR
jgi:hypothetical protein